MKIRSLVVQGPYERAVLGRFESEGVYCAELRLSLRCIRGLHFIVNGVRDKRIFSPLNQSHIA